MQSKCAVAGTLLACALITLLPPPASSAPNEVLILESTVASPATTSREYYWVQQLGFTPVVINNAAWLAMNTTQFSDYEAIVLGDPSCGYDTIPILAPIQNNGVWNAAVDGNIILIGTDPALHFVSGGDSLTKYGIDYATADAGSGKTGAFITLSCYYGGAFTPTQVTMLDSLSPYGTFSVFNSQCHNLAHKVINHPALTGVNDSILSNWYCSTHEVFDTWPADFLVLAIGRNLGSYVAIDGSVGQPYILVRGEGFTSTNCVNAPADILNWWPLDEPSGPTAADIRGSADNGLHIGNPTPVPGKVQTALLFDGIDDQVDILNTVEVNFGAGDFSIDAWINTTAAVGTMALVDKIDTATTTGYALLIDNGILAIELADGASTIYPSGAFVADGAWRLVAVSVDRDSSLGITFYVDGLPVATADPTPHPGSLTNTNQLVLGTRSAGNFDRYSGILDEIEMFDRALTDYDVFTLLLADSLGKCPVDVVVGSCCLPDKSCVLTLGQSECDDLGGIYLGDSTTCDSLSCDQFAAGACCLPDGSCVDTLGYYGCVSLGGMFQGLGTTCLTTECLPFGACCAPGGGDPGGSGGHGGCFLTMGPGACANAGGIYQGDGTSCDSVNCDTCICLATGDIDGDGEGLTEIDLEILIGIVYGWSPPIDSMCHADLNGDCVVDQADIDLLECYLTYGISCFTPYGGYPVVTCCNPSTVTGACCLIDTCYQYAPQNCIDGDYQGDSTLCVTVDCPQDTVIVIGTGGGFPIDTVIIIIISWPPIDIDPTGPIVVGPFDPGPISVGFVMADTATISWDAAWEPLEQSGVPLPAGAFLQFKAYVHTSAADRSIGVGRAEKLNNGSWQLEADFSSTGATRQSVQVFSNDQIVATLQQHSGPAGTVARPPDDWHWSTHPPSGARIQHGCTGSWSTPVEIHLDPLSKDAMHVMADSVKFVPENPTVPIDGYLSKVILTAARIPAIPFLGWTAVPGSCCTIRGDINHSGGSPTVADLTYLIAYLFRGGPMPPCEEEADVTGNGGAANIADLTYLVSYLFSGGPAPAPCP